MKLTIVGCSGSYPTPEAPASCYLVEHDGLGLVLDLGNGALGPLQSYIDPLDDDRLAGVVLTHCHIDHCADLGSLYVMRRYGPRRPSHRLRVVGPAGAAQRIADIYGPMSGGRLDDELDFQTLADSVTIGPFEVQAIRALHPVDAYSIRVSAGGRSVTYSGDTGPNPSLVQLAIGTDIALFEASMVGDDNPVDLHMTGADAARTAQAAGAGLLVLTHLVSWNDPDQPRLEAAGHFSGPIEQARAGMVIDLG